LVNWNFEETHPAIRMIKHFVATNKIPHAILLVGAKGTGRLKLAQLFAKTLNCERLPKPCNSCSTCSRIDRSVDFDVQELKISESNQKILIEQVREFERRAVLTTTSGKYKVAIIPQAESLTTGAANAFLKTLEEPPPMTKMILISPTIHDLPSTITSRCSVIRLPAVSDKEIDMALDSQAKSLPPGHRDLIKRFSEGRIDWALKMACNTNLISELVDLLEEFDSALSGDIVSKMELANKLGDDRQAAHEALNTLALKLADEMRIARKDGASQSLANYRLWHKNTTRLDQACLAISSNTMLKPTLENLFLGIS
tara:strand:+ start:5974 stop:6912 length:939 start_codon:yes stop_codon:yes gene_type:complete